MPRDTLDKANNMSRPMVAIPSRRMKGWVMVPYTEDSEPDTPTQKILPSKRRRSQPKRLQNEMELWGTKRKKSAVPANPPLKENVDQTECARKGVGETVRVGKYNHLEREIKRLKIQNDLRAVAESEEIQRLKDEVKRLQKLKTEQSRKLDWVISNTVGSTSPSTVIDEPEILKMKDGEIEQQNAVIMELQSSLSRALKFDSVLSQIGAAEEAPTAPNFIHEMKGIRLNVIRTAELLSDCVYPLQGLSLAPKIHPGLWNMIKKTVSNVKILSSMPGLALQALLFHIIRDHVIYSEMWRALHMEGYMLRGYQKAIQQTAPSGFLESFHRAVLSHVLNRDAEFNRCFLGANAEELQTQIMELLYPVLDPAKLKTKESFIRRELRALLSQAFVFRSQCFPTDGIRYEVIQFKPGDRFDPTVMEAQDAAGNLVSVPANGTKPSIKLCVHGFVEAHAIKDSRTGVDKIKELSQPFQTLDTKQGRRRITGEVISGKAIVII